MVSTRHLAFVAAVAAIPVASCARGTSGPKLTLRYHPPAGAAYHYTLEQHNAMKFENGPMASMPEQQMTMHMFFSQAVTGTTSDGVGVTVTFDSTTMESPSLTPGSFNPALDRMRGMKSNLVYDQRMTVLRAEFTGAPGMASPITEQLGKSIKGMTFPLPEQPVGVGDSWITQTELPLGQVGAGSAPAKATTKLTVKEIHTGPDTTVLLGVETTYPGDPIAVNQQGQQLTLKLSGNLTGEQLFSITKGAAVRSSMTGTMRIHVSGGATGPQGTDMSMQQATKLQLNDAK